MVTCQSHNLKIVGSNPISGKMEYSQVVRHSFLVRTYKGSNPFIPKLLQKFNSFNAKFWLALANISKF